MGGAKKKPIAKAEKGLEQTSPGAEAVAKPKKQEKTKEKGFQGKEPAVFLTRLDDRDAVKTLLPLKAVTIYGVAKAFNINASVANAVIRSLESKNLLLRVGGYSGHYVYALTEQGTKMLG